MFVVPSSFSCFGRGDILPGNCVPSVGTSVDELPGVLCGVTIGLGATPLVLVGVFCTKGGEVVGVTGSGSDNAGGKLGCNRGVVGV